MWSEWNYILPCSPITMNNYKLYRRVLSGSAGTALTTIDSTRPHLSSILLKLG